MAAPERARARSSGIPTISAHGHIVTGFGFLPGRRVAVRITRAGEDISDYLTYIADGNGHLRCELLDGTTGTLHIAATDHRIDPNGACGLLWSNTYTLPEAELT